MFVRRRLFVLLVIITVLFGLLCYARGKTYLFRVYRHSARSYESQSNASPHTGEERITYENPPEIEKEPLYIYATIKRKTAGGYLCYDSANKNTFLLKGLTLKPDIETYSIKNGIKFYVSVAPEKPGSVYEIKKNASGNYDLSITENGIFVKEITPDLFVFETDGGIRLQISGMKKSGIDKTCIRNRCRFRISCGIGNSECINGVPVFKYFGVKPLDGD